MSRDKEAFFRATKVSRVKKVAGKEFFSSFFFFFYKNNTGIDKKNLFVNFEFRFQPGNYCTLRRIFLAADRSR